MSTSVTQVRDLRIRFGDTEAVRGVSFDLRVGVRVGLLGESGSGKTLTGRALLGLLPPGATASGQVLVAGHDMLNSDERELRRIRGREVALVAQDPRTALNPLVRIGDHIAEPMRARGVPRTEARVRALELIDLVRLGDPELMARRYPGSLSGGQRQRVGIAMALAADPALLIADEPTSALDAVVQDEILRLLAPLADQRAMLFITHDISAAAQLCDELVVLRRGEVADAGPTERVVNSPAHPYVGELLAAARATALPTPAGQVVP